MKKGRPRLSRHSFLSIGATGGKPNECHFLNVNGELPRFGSTSAPELHAEGVTSQLEGRHGLLGPNRLGDLQNSISPMLSSVEVLRYSVTRRLRTSVVAGQCRNQNKRVQR